LYGGIVKKQQSYYAALWRKLDQPGHESGRLFFAGSCWHLTGTAVFLDEGQPCQLAYHVVCDEEWNTRSGRITGWRGKEAVEVEVLADAGRRWRLNGVECPGVAGCVDLDLNFSPSTNVLPLRRLRLPVGLKTGVRAAWLRFPAFALEPLEQTYCRIDETLYAYESSESGFSVQLRVNADGFISCYPGLWEIEPCEGDRSRFHGPAE
jgi:hypothetical protein